jgi:hypothetical protein
MPEEPTETEFKQLSPTEWDAERAPYDFHVRLEQDDYVIDVFDSSIDTPPLPFVLDTAVAKGV